MSIDKYSDILNLPYPGPTSRARMSMVDRGAQFSPFAALVGFEAAIAETARRTETPIDLADSGVAMVDEKLRLLREMDRPRVDVTHFLPDSRKTGGAYVTHTGIVKRVDAVSHTLQMTDGTVIPFTAILDIHIP